VFLFTSVGIVRKMRHAEVKVGIPETVTGKGGN